MNQAPLAKRVQIAAALCEGNSIASTCRMTGAAKRTVLNFLADLGTACAKYHNENVLDLKTTKVQCDEIWSFVACKDKNVYEDETGFGRGSVWTWTALDADSKLCISYLVGLRDAGYAFEFMRDVAARLANRVQLTTDGHKSYLSAVEDSFAGNIDYAMLVKLYGGENPGEGRYSPAKCLGTTQGTVSGMPEDKHISTSYVERQNLTMRMNMRRFTRLTNAFSKKVEGTQNAVALYFAHYNFVRVHKTLRVTPAMEAGLTDRVWSVEDLVALVPAPVAVRPKTYRRRKTVPTGGENSK